MRLLRAVPGGARHEEQNYLDVAGRSLSSDGEEVAPHRGTAASRWARARRPAAASLALGGAAAALAALLQAGAPWRRPARPPAGFEDAAKADDAVVALAAARAPKDAELCTDGNVVQFSVQADFSSVGGTQVQTILRSSSGALDLSLCDGRVRVAMDTFNFKSMSASLEIQEAGSYDMLVTKSPDALCLRLCRVSDECASSDVPEECTYVPYYMPETSFQMKSVGKLVWGDSSVVTPMGFTQMSGFVSASFSLARLPMRNLWGNDAEWGNLTLALQEGLASVAGEGFGPDNVHVTPVAPSLGGQGTEFQATLMITEAFAGRPCVVEHRLAASLSGRDVGGGVADSAFGAAVGRHVKAVALEDSPTGTITVGHAAVPAESMSCGRIRCRRSLARDLPPEARCLGGGCARTCCEDDWAPEPLPFEEAGSEEQDAMEAEAGLRASAGEAEQGKVLDGVTPESDLPGVGVRSFPRASARASPRQGFLDRLKVVVRKTRARAAAAADEELTTIEGGLTMSFVVAGISDRKMVDKCKCENELKEAVREAVAYSGGVGVSYHQVDVAIKAIKDDGHAAKPVNVSSLGPLAKISFGLAALTERQRQAEAEHGKKLGTLLGGSPWSENPVDGAELARATDVAMKGDGGIKELSRDQKEQLAKKQPQGIEEGFGINLEELSQGHLGGSRRLFGFPWLKGAGKSQGKNAVFVAVQIRGCGAQCDALKARLLDGSTASRIQQRVRLVVGNGFFGRGSMGEVTVVQVSMPGKVMTCDGYQCVDSFALNSKPSLRCFGTSCEETCCAPRTCSQVSCGLGLRNRPTQADVTCSGLLDCGAKCCALSCSTHKCPCGTCPKANAWMIAADPTMPDAACCNNVTCCNAPIATCISCLKCQSKLSYCASSLFDFIKAAKKFKDGKHRRLEASTAVGGGAAGSPEAFSPPPSEEAEEEEDADEEDALAAEPPSLDAVGALGGYLPEMALTAGASAAELEEDLRDLAESLAALEPGNARLRGKNGSSEERRLQDAYYEVQEQRKTLLQDAQKQMKESAAFIQAVWPHPLQSAKSGAARTIESWMKEWHIKELDAKARHHGLIAGCEIVATRCCKYVLSAVFKLHRGCKKDPLAVNTVAVLSDTLHAVSCGDDGLCWVWKIRSGCPVQVFFPVRTCPITKPLGPVNTVSVLNDATYIVSAGVNSDGSGEAYIWDWKWGHQKTSQSCPDEAFLSSAEMPAWRMVLLGCADGFVHVWQWDSGNAMQLPYNARTTAEILGYLQNKLNLYRNQALDGLHRLMARKITMKEDDFVKLLLKVYPGLKHKVEFFSKLHDFFHRNTFGAVNAVAYVPIRLRFATGHCDGRVRYWSAESGTLLMVMKGHQGPVNAVTPSPTKLEALSGGDDGTVRLWCLQTGIQKMLLYQPYGGPVWSLAMIPGGHKVVVGSNDGYIRIWDIRTGLLLCAINTGGGPVRGLAVNPSNPLGQILAATEDGFVRVYNPA